MSKKLNSINGNDTTIRTPAITLRKKSNLLLYGSLIMASIHPVKNPVIESIKIMKGVILFPLL
jgi:hypothetical protein